MYPLTPHKVSLLHYMPKSPNGALQHGSMSSLKSDTRFLDEFTGLYDLFMALGRKGTVVPSGECVRQVPLRLPMTNKHEG